MRWWWLCSAALLCAVPDAHAHLRLQSSAPAHGDTVRQPLTEIRLVFTQPVEARYTVVTLLDAYGREIRLGTLVPVGSSPTTQYLLELERPLMSGAFTVRWKTAGTDAHVVSGLFDFVVDVMTSDSAAATAPTTTPPTHNDDHRASAELQPMYNPETSPAWLVARWLNFVALLLVVGTVAFRFGVLERARKQLDAPTVVEFDDGVRRLGVVAALLLIVSSGMRLWLQSGSLHGPEHMWHPSMLSAMIFKTGWGKAWLAQTVAAFGFLIAVRVKTQERLESWFSALPFAVIAASTPAFSGHAAAVQQMAIVPVVDDAIHVMAASAWLGTLAVLLFTAVPRALRAVHGFETISVLVRTFSPFALAMATIAIFTGALNAFVHIASVQDLWTTPYGRLLSLKIGLVLIALTIGAYNWQVVKPRLGTASVTTHFQKSAASELAVAVIILLITAVLVGTPTD